MCIDTNALSLARSRANTHTDTHSLAGSSPQRVDQGGVTRQANDGVEAVYVSRM